jgi:hypothetical protein
MTPRLRDILIRSSIVLVTLLALITRFFASSVLGEPFFGETITNLLSAKEKPVLLSQEDVRIVKSVIHPLTIDTTINHRLQFDFLNDKLKNIEVIGLGEATHGTKEFLN